MNNMYEKEIDEIMTIYRKYETPEYRTIVYLQKIAENLIDIKYLLKDISFGGTDE